MINNSTAAGLSSRPHLPTHVNFPKPSEISTSHQKNIKKLQYGDTDRNSTQNQRETTSVRQQKIPESRSKNNESISRNDQYKINHRPSVNIENRRQVCFTQGDVQPLQNPIHPFFQHVTVIQHSRPALEVQNRFYSPAPISNISHQIRQTVNVPTFVPRRSSQENCEQTKKLPFTDRQTDGNKFGMRTQIDKKQREKQEKTKIDEVISDLWRQNKKLRQQNSCLREQNQLLFDKLSSKTSRFEKINKIRRFHQPAGISASKITHKNQIRKKDPLNFPSFVESAETETDSHFYEDKRRLERIKSQSMFEKNNWNSNASSYWRSPFQHQNKKQVLSKIGSSISKHKNSMKSYEKYHSKKNPQQISQQASQKMRNSNKNQQQEEEQAQIEQQQFYDLYNNSAQNLHKNYLKTQNHRQKIKNIPSKASSKAQSIKQYQKNRQSSRQRFSSDFDLNERIDKLKIANELLKQLTFY